MRKTITLAVAVLLLLIIAVPASAAGNQGQAGNSNVYHCYFPIVADGYDGAWGKIMVQDLDGMLSYVVNFHGLEAGDYTLKSGGFELAAGMPNKGGNLHLSGTTNDWGARFNLWIGATRILRTEKNLCTPEMDPNGG